MERQEEIYPECNVDTNLMGFIIGGAVKHKHCCNEVAKALNGTDGFAIGVVDDDKRPATFDDGFVPHESTWSHVAFYPHKDGKRFLFKIHKAMDEFVFDMARDMRVDLRDLGYPDTLMEFKKITKREDASQNPKLRKLFAKIADNRELTAFRNTVRYLVHAKYQADVNVAKDFFDGKLTTDDLRRILASTP